MNARIEHPIQWDDAKVSRLWDYYARTPPYSEIYFSKLFGDQMLLRSGLPLGESLIVLDFGCGPGFIWEHMLKLGATWRYTALDFSPDSVQKAQQRGRGHPQFDGATQVTGLPSSLPSGHYDAVLLFEVVEHLNDSHLDGTIREVTRLLKPGGVVVVSTPNEEQLADATHFCPECGAVYHEWQHVRSWSVPSLARYLAHHGLQLRNAQTLDFRANSLKRKLLKLGRRMMHGKRPEPHMIAVFQKPI